MDILFGAFGVWLAFLFFCSWIPRHIRHAVATAPTFWMLMLDIGVHLTMQLLLGGDSWGRASALFAGVIINMTMHTYRRWCIYQRDRPVRLPRHAQVPRAQRDLDIDAIVARAIKLGDSQ